MLKSASGDFGFILVLALAAVAQTTATASAGSAPASSVRPTVVLADFKNQTGNSLFDDSLTQALSLEIAQSPFLIVLSERQVTDALRGMGQPFNARITASLGRELCLRTNSQDVLEGGIALANHHYQIDVSAIDCRSGATVVRERVEAPSNKEVLQALHKASSKLRAAMGEPSASVRKFDIPAEATTSSLEALAEYRLGLAIQRESGDAPSIPFFKRALARDPDFPMADTLLAGIYGNLRQPSLAIRYAARGYELRNRVGERERFHIAGVYFLETGQMAREIRNYQSWQVEYPRDFVPYNNLGNDYAALGQLNRSLREYRAALQLTPSVIGYTNVVGMELALNRLDDAGATLQEAFAHKLDGRYLHQTLYWLAFLRGDTRQMDRQVAWTAGRAGDEDPLLSMQSDTEAYYGRLRKARNLTRQAVESAVRAGSKETAALWQVNDALREAEVGEVALARQGVASALALSRGRDVELMGAFALARAGYGTQSAALVRSLEKAYPTDSLLKLYWLPTIHATIELDGGNYPEALKELAGVLPYELGGAGTFINYVYPAYVRGDVYLHTRNADAAGVEFQKVLDHSGIVINFVTGALAFLQRGRAYAMAGDTAKARAAYQEFFTLWKTADPDLPVLLQARSEYSSLHLAAAVQ
jgi:eukaryotic-like serine/threonine-protein kinase